MLRALRRGRRAARAGAVVPEDHALRGAAAGQPGRAGLDAARESLAAQLDWPLRGAGVHLRIRGGRAGGADRGIHHATGHDLRCNLCVAGARASAVSSDADAGVLVNSGDFTGLLSAEARAAIAAAFEAHGKGHRRVTYHLRDWLISRQRYWGPPIPIIYCPEHGAVPVPEEDLPVVLPYVENYRPTGTGVSPLASVPEFVETTCPTCGRPARRETDVSDNFLDSAWDFFRYPSSDDEREPWNPELTRKWLPPRMYIGGAEHSVLHLMYARFITMAMHEMGYLEFEEPFPRFRANGIITAAGAKISKSHGNTINPDVYVRRYGP